MVGGGMLAVKTYQSDLVLILVVMEYGRWVINENTTNEELTLS